MKREVTSRYKKHERLDFVTEPIKIQEVGNCEPKPLLLEIRHKYC
jgi:hypothetical protein